QPLKVARPQPGAGRLRQTRHGRRVRTARFSPRQIQREQAEELVQEQLQNAGRIRSAEGFMQPLQSEQIVDAPLEALDLRGLIFAACLHAQGTVAAETYAHRRAPRKRTPKAMEVVITVISPRRATTRGLQPHRFSAARAHPPWGKPTPAPARRP